MSQKYVLKQFGPIEKVAENLSLQDCEIPKAGNGQAVIKVHSVAINYRDLCVLRGDITHNGAKAPIVPLSDAAGEVYELGQGASGFSKGDKVCVNVMPAWKSGEIKEEFEKSYLGGPAEGVMQKYIVVPADSLVKIASGLSTDEACTINSNGVAAYQCLYGGPVTVQKGDNVLILGTGGGSVFGAQMAKAAGANVIFTSSFKDKLEKGTKLFQPNHSIFWWDSDWKEQVMKATSGKGIDHVVEIGCTGTLERSLSVLRRGGYIHEVGSLGLDTEDFKDEAVRDAPTKIHFASANIRGIQGGGSVEHFKGCMAAIEKAGIKPVIEKTFTWKQGVELFQEIKKRGHVGKIVMKVA